MSLPRRAYKVLTAAQSEELLAKGTFAGAPVDLADGFIHLSAAGQVDKTVAKHFAGQSDIWLAEVDLDALAADLRWEPSRGGALFPHIYGALPLSAVTAHFPLEYGEDGKIVLPG